MSWNQPDRSSHACAAEAKQLAAGGAGSARTAYSAPTTPGFERKEQRKARNSSKHKALFTLEAGALQVMIPSHKCWPCLAHFPSIVSPNVSCMNLPF